MNAILTRSPVRKPQPNLTVASVRVIAGISPPVVRDAATLRVLLVDDCPFQRILSSVLLSRWGILPCLASDGLEAVLLAGESHVDLILMDIDMPVLDGMTAAARIRQNARRRGAGPAPIVAYTAARMEGNESAWTRAGINASLAKPCRAGDMGKCLAAWCGIRTEPLHH